MKQMSFVKRAFAEECKWKAVTYKKKNRTRWAERFKKHTSRTRKKCRGRT